MVVGLITKLLSLTDRAGLMLLLELPRADLSACMQFVVMVAMIKRTSPQSQDQIDQVRPRQ